MHFQTEKRSDSDLYLFDTSFPISDFGLQRVNDDSPKDANKICGVA